MKTEKIFLTKEDVLSFNLWENYFNFLTALKDLFEKELATQLNGEKINSFIESEFYEKDGSLKEKSSKDYPDSEEVHFEVENKEHSVGFTFYYGDVSKSSLDLYSITEEGGEDYKTFRHTYACKTNELFLPEVIEAAVYWIQTGELDDFAKGVVESA